LAEIVRDEVLFEKEPFALLELMTVERELEGFIAVLEPIRQEISVRVGTRCHPFDLRQFVRIEFENLKAMDFVGERVGLPDWVEVDRFDPIRAVRPMGDSDRDVKTGHDPTEF